MSRFGEFFFSSSASEAAIWEDGVSLQMLVGGWAFREYIAAAGDVFNFDKLRTTARPLAR